MPVPVFELKPKNAAVTSDGNPDGPPRFFEDGGAALRYARRFLQCQPDEWASLPAAVHDPSELLKHRPRLTAGPDGTNVFFLGTASADGERPLST
jgi:hypothetical protein